MSSLQLMTLLDRSQRYDVFKVINTNINP